MKSATLSLLLASTLLAAPAFADQQSEETERIVMRHLAASEAGDASVVPRDYSDDAVWLYGPEPVKGMQAIQKAFEALYARTRLQLTYTRKSFSGEFGYVVWTMNDIRGSDTFVVRNGKIVAQTSIVFAPPRP